MPYALAILGFILIVAGYRGKQSELGELLSSAFKGPGNYFYWLISIATVGSIGYVPSLEKFSRAFMGLLIIVLILVNNDRNQSFGFFQRFMEAFGGANAGSEPNYEPSEIAPNLNADPNNPFLDRINPDDKLDYYMNRMQSDGDFWHN